MIAPFVDQAWVEAHPDVILADVRWGLAGGAKHDDYLAGHLPGAVFVNLDRDLAAHGVEGAGRHPLPDPKRFANALAHLGIGDADVVVAYDDDSGAIAARLVWMLRTIGSRAAVLDGGMKAWKGELEAGEPPHRRLATFTPRAWPADRLAAIDELASADGVVIDARAADRFAGEPDGIDPRPGHIPGSRNLPCRGHVGADGRLLPVRELEKRFAAVGIEHDTPLIASCGSGVTACLNLLVAEHLDLQPGRLFPGSWSQYSRDTSRPVELGADPAGL
ncbi:MAG: sulfurtransferase [Solirubrobacteraceae bacterium]|nr:sulfurtransferase [Solirubrobacteraceae bacterium]